MAMQIYDPYSPHPISPIALVGQNLGVYTEHNVEFFKIDFIEGLPPGSQTLIDLGPCAAGAQLNAAILTNLQLRENDFIHLRWKVLDDFEATLWLVSGIPRFNIRQITQRITLFTPQNDPYLNTTTFFVLGPNKDPFLQVNNPNPAYALTQTRAIFWGFKYILKPLTEEPADWTYVPAEGKA